MVLQDNPTHEDLRQTMVDFIRLLPLSVMYDPKTLAAYERVAYLIKELHNERT
jgi:hypothetical protein